MKVQSTHLWAKSMNGFPSPQANMVGHLAIKPGLHPPSLKPTRCEAPKKIAAAKAKSWEQKSLQQANEG
jgi:hypothetical protein